MIRPNPVQLWSNGVLIAFLTVLLSKRLLTRPIWHPRRRIRQPMISRWRKSSANTQRKPKAMAWSRLRQRG